MRSGTGVPTRLGGGVTTSNWIGEDKTSGSLSPTQKRRSYHIVDWRAFRLFVNVAYSLLNGGNIRSAAAAAPLGTPIMKNEPLNHRSG